ncbi:MAG: HD domain-containing protein [Patescibacteria group bacterium]
MDNTHILNFFYELGQQRYIEHEGWRLIGVNHIESIGEHTARAAQIGYILAVMEGYEKPEAVCTMVVFHDIGECRLGDIHKVANRYIQADELRAVREQTAPLGKIGEGVFELVKATEERSSRAGIIANDADKLELAVCAKEYMEKGYVAAQSWIDNISKVLKTDSAKKLLAELPSIDSTAWWKGLKKI